MSLIYKIVEDLEDFGFFGDEPETDKDGNLAPIDDLDDLTTRDFDDVPNEKNQSNFDRSIKLRELGKDYQVTEAQNPTVVKKIKAFLEEIKAESKYIKSVIYNIMGNNLEIFIEILNGQEHLTAAKIIRKLEKVRPQILNVTKRKVAKYTFVTFAVKLSDL